MADTGSGGLLSQGLGAVGGLTPWGAAAGALSSAISTPNTSATGATSTGSVSAGGFNFNASPDPQARLLLYGLAAVVGVLVLGMLGRGRR